MPPVRPQQGARVGAKKQLKPDEEEFTEKSSLSENAAKEEKGEDLGLLDDDDDDNEESADSRNLGSDKKEEKTIKLLIVDDDEVMHGSTKRTLDIGIFRNNYVRFISAYNSKEAKAIINENDDIAVILLDVVMDTEDAGFRVLDYLRKKIENHHTQVILRTGQPGLAPELKCVQDFDICNYLEKSFTTSLRLQTAVIAAYRTFDYSYNMEKKIYLRTQEIAKKNETLFNLVEGKNILIRTLCHDLNNPISTIKGACYKLKAVDEKGEKYIEKVNRALKKQIDLIDYIRISQSLEDHKQQITLQEVKLKDIIEDIILFFETRFEEKNITFISAETDIEKMIAVDPTPFSNIIINNIISNAIKFTPDNGKISVKTSEIDEDWISLEISDSGIGIPPSILENLFDPQVATTRQGTAGEVGTGFGMPLVKTYMNYFGGDVKVNTKDQEEFPNDHGTTFSLKLKRRIT